MEELKLQLLAKSSICPGIITIIWSLITSSTNSNDVEDPELEYKQILQFNAANKLKTASRQDGETTATPGNTKQQAN